MATPAPSIPPYTPYPPPRRGNGCLYGCVAMLFIMALPVVLAAGYGTWFLYRGLRHEPVIQLAHALVAHDGIARRVLGTPIEITGIQGNAWSWIPGTGQTRSYILSLSGPRGEAALAVRSHSGRSGPELDDATLIVPGGQRYDLLHHRALPDGQDLTDTI